MTARDDDRDSALLANVMHFARILRATGLPIGPGRVLEAVRAVQAVGLTSKVDFYWTLHAALVNRHDQRELFDQAFRMFWHDPQMAERMMALLLPQAKPDTLQARPEVNRRLAEALQAAAPPRPNPPDDLEERIDSLKKAGLRFRNQMEEGPGGKQIQIEDPDGNPIELFEPVH